MIPQPLLDATRSFAKDREVGDMNTKPAHPSIEHDRAARAVVDFFPEEVIDAVIPTCSCGGK